MQMMLPHEQPIIPTQKREPFESGIFELVRSRCRLISRNGNLMSRFDGLGDQIAASLDAVDSILDGEVIATDETGRPRSTSFSSARGCPAMWPSIRHSLGRWRRSAAIAACGAPAVPAQPSVKEIGDYRRLCERGRNRGR
jgi:hypothetical protein